MYRLLLCTYSVIICVDNCIIKITDTGINPKILHLQDMKYEVHKAE